MSGKKFTSGDILIAAGALHTQLAAGVMLRTAVQRMGKLQQSHAATWMEVQQTIEGGGTLSEALADYWPESVIAGIRAGERTGNVAEVMGNIQASLSALSNIWKEMAKLAYPLAVVSGGLGIFIFFMVGVMPAITRANPGAASQSSVLALSAWMAQQYEQNGLLIAIACGVTLLGTVAYFAVPSNRQRVIAFVDNLPVVGEAMRSLWFGAWSYQMALLDRAGGIPVQECLRLSAKALPTVYQSGLILMADEVVARGLNDAATSGDSNDPRSRWPFYVTLSFQMAHDTGALGEKLQKFAPAMIDEGTRSISRSAMIANLIALLISGTLMAVPMAGYFTAIAGALKKAFG